MNEKNQSIKGFLQKIEYFGIGLLLRRTILLRVHVPVLVPAPLLFPVLVLSLVLVLPLVLLLPLGLLVGHGRPILLVARAVLQQLLELLLNVLLLLLLLVLLLVVSFPIIRLPPVLRPFIIRLRGSSFFLVSSFFASSSSACILAALSRKTLIMASLLALDSRASLMEGCWEARFGGILTMSSMSSMSLAAIYRCWRVGGWASRKSDDGDSLYLEAVDGGGEW